MTKAKPAKSLAKISSVVALPECKQGASLAELAHEAQWPPRTTQAALTGLNKKGHAIERKVVDGASRYSVVEGA